MRVYSSLALVPGIPTPLPEPKRFILPVRLAILIIHGRR